MKNRYCFREAKRVIPGGVNSPVRSFAAVGGNPFFVERGRGSALWDVEGKRYIDYVNSWGALILGHAHPQVVAAVRRAALNGMTFGTPTRAETTLAQTIVGAFPSIDRVRFVNSGTEAVMSAVRLARAYTGRSRVIKFDGGYHGHVDYLLSKAGSGLATLGVPASQGVPRSFAKETVTVPFNDLGAFKQALKAHRGKIACVLIEPVPANTGLLPPEPNFLKAVRQLTQKEKIVLIFDEVISGFRVAFGGAQTKLKIRPDLTCLGKIIGGGFPIGAYGGRNSIMKLIAPTGAVYQAGTLSGHPVAMAAGIATLKTLKPAHYRQLEIRAVTLANGLRRAADQAGVKLTVHQVGSLVTPFFTGRPVRNAADVRRSNTKLYAALFRGMRERGVYVPPSAFEAWFVSAAHTPADIRRTVKAAENIFQRMSG